MSSVHLPVLPVQVLDLLAPQPGQTIVDATLGGGGHACLIAEKLGAKGHLIALDRDPAALERARVRLQQVSDTPKLTLVHSNFERLRTVLDELKIDRVDGILADLGFSSDQIESAERGLSFQREGPLDMRLDPTDEQTAGDIIASWSESDLADLFFYLGEERQSRRIARKIVAVRDETPITTTIQLADLVRSCLPRSKTGLDPATRVFQALRIGVNDELGALKRLVEALPKCVKPGGRVAIISFHSLEDRIVKWAFRESATWEILTKKPVEADEVEEAANPRSRSAKLRVAKLV
ncbi:MAG: 16S rRNA (cytosine(1402)-N(4))-methyltransferase RsmH [Gemmatales bacterium]